MIQINQCRVSADNTKLYVDVETNVGFKITYANLWSSSTFKVYSKRKELVLSGESNVEKFIVTAASLGLSKFDGIYFIEFETDDDSDEYENAQKPVMAVVVNLVRYYKCALEMMLKVSGSHLNLFASGVTDSGDANNAMAIHLLLDGINEAIKINRFQDAINLLSRLEILCASCSSCNDSSEEFVGCSDCGN